MSVLSHLTSTATNLLNKGPASEGINTSLSTLKTRVDSYFSATDLREHFTFGSWPRATSIPRQADQYSDVDYMVVFRGDTSSKPQTLLDRLRRFVEEKYSTSDVKQSRPTIVLTLNHIQFELVPAVRAFDTSDGTLQIPSASSSFSDWQPTYPYAAVSAIDKHNGDNSYFSKPLVRLLKYWNCQADPYSRPYGSFEVEEYVVGKYFYPRSNLRDYFYGAVEGLPSAWDLAQSKKDRIARLKEIVQNAKKYEQDEMPATAESEIKKAIPVFE
jgi:hypothetical protein